MFPSIKNRHVIEKTAFEVAFGSEEDAFAQHAALDELIKRRLIRTVEQVFDEVSDSTNVIQLESLEIDLGVVNYASYADEMDERLKARLRELFREKMRVEKVGDFQTIGVVSEEKSDLVKMEYYLVNGCLPWNAEALDGRAHVTLLERILKNSAKDFLVFLKKTGCQDIIISRLVRQFPGKFMRELFGLITNHQEPDLAGLVVHLQRILANSTVFKNMEQERIADFFWEKLFDSLLKKYSSVNSDEILAGIIKAIELISYKTGEKLYRVLVDEIVIFMENTGRKNHIDYIRKRLPRTRTSYSDIGETDSRPNVISEIAPNNLVNINAEITVENNEYSKFIPNITFKKQPINYYGEGYKQNKFRLISDANNFNNIPYIGQSIQGLPSQKILKDCKKNDEEFCEELTPHGNSAAESENAIAANNKGKELNNEDILRACEIYEYIFQRLFSIKVDNAPLKIFASLIDELAEISAAHILKLYREFQVEKPSASQLERRLSSQDLRRLIEVFIDLSQQQDIRACSALLYKINYYADKAIDVNKIYAKVLERLPRDSTIDFDEIIYKEASLNREEDTSIGQGVLNDHGISNMPNVVHEIKNSNNLIDDLGSIFTDDDMRSAIRFFIASASYEEVSSYSFISTIEHYSTLVINKKRYYGKILECVLIKKYFSFKKIIFECSDGKINLNLDNKKYDFRALNSNFYYKYDQVVSLLGGDSKDQIAALKDQYADNQYLIGSNVFTPKWRSIVKSAEYLTRPKMDALQMVRQRDLLLDISNYGFFQKKSSIDKYFYDNSNQLQSISFQAGYSKYLELTHRYYKFFENNSVLLIKGRLIKDEYYKGGGGYNKSGMSVRVNEHFPVQPTNKYVSNYFLKVRNFKIGVRKNAYEFLGWLPVQEKTILNKLVYNISNQSVTRTSGLITPAREYNISGFSEDLPEFVVYTPPDVKKTDCLPWSKLFLVENIISTFRYVGKPGDVIITFEDITNDEIFTAIEVPECSYLIGGKLGIYPTLGEFSEPLLRASFEVAKPSVEDRENAIFAAPRNNIFMADANYKIIKDKYFPPRHEVNSTICIEGYKKITDRLSTPLIHINNDASDKFVSGSSIVTYARYLKNGFVQHHVNHGVSPSIVRLNYKVGKDYIKDNLLIHGISNDSGGASKSKYGNVDRESKNGPDYIFNNSLDIKFLRHLENDSTLVEKNMTGICNVIWRINKKIDTRKSVSEWLVDFYEALFDKKPVTLSFDSLSYCFYKIRNKCLSNLDHVLFSLHNRKINFEFSSKKIDVKINNYSNYKNSVSEVKISGKFHDIFPGHDKNNFSYLNSSRNVDDGILGGAEKIYDKSPPIIKKSVESTAEFNEDADPGQLIRVMDYMLSTQSRRLFKTLPPRLENRRICERLIEILPERQLTKILLLLKAAEYRHVHLSADMIVQACYGYRQGIKSSQLNYLKWRFIFRYLFEEGKPFDERLFVVGLTDYLSEEISDESNEKFRSELCQRLAMNILPSTRDPVLRLIKILSTTVQPLNDLSENFDVPRPVILSNKKNKPFFQSSEQIYIANAGQVLVAPYLPRLFGMLNLMDQSVFKDRIAAERAVHLLQFMVNERVDAPEHQLVLNKILCGIDPGLPIKKEIEIYDHEIELVESLLQAVIKAWSDIGNTSISGLREVFFQRQGRLHLKGDAWQLQVEKKPFDMLLDKVPWNYSVIKLPWMERVIYVDWR